MDLPVLGLLLIVAAVVLYGVARANRRVALSVLGTEISSVEELLALYALVADQVGTGLFAQRVGLQGTLECDEPLQSELGNTPCAAFRYRVERRWEEEYEERDANGHRVRRTRSGRDAVAGNERRVPFWVHDATGRLPVIPDGARLEMERTVDRFEPGNRGGVVRFRGFELRLNGAGGARRTLGYHFHEEVLPLGRPIYVLGNATDRAGSLAVGPHHELGEPFLVSLRTREQVVHAARQITDLARYAAYVCAPLGMLLLIIGILVHR
ncbi:MAG TPA: E3 ubiquitin ligase family protein, partial [Chloroflexota bacterium]|nr:E3 ubiquitin ligase family protein [Chloroflexota bacterium]